MGDSIGDSIVTPYITNLSGKDLNRCQMNRMFFWPDMFLGYVLSFVRRSKRRRSVNFHHNFQKTFSNPRFSLKQILSFKSLSSN